jgi:hypothetical protein
MPLQDPVAVYNAADNMEAQLLCNLLNGSGVEAYLTEDVSTVGVWMFGLLSEIHKPQVWVDRSAVERAKPVLEEYERRLLERQDANLTTTTDGGATVEALCEKCGQRSVFPIAQQGTIQDCPHCGEYVDVGDTADSEPWWGEEGPAGTAD